MTRSYKGVLEPFAQGLGRFLGLIEDKGVRDQIRPVVEEALKRSPLQDAMNQAGAIRMGVREIPKVPGQAPTPEGFGGFKPVPNPPTSKVPLQKGPVRMEPGFSRGGTQGVQLKPGAIEPPAVERFEVEGQLRIPYTQPGKGGQMYSPKGSSETPEVVEAMLRSNLGDFIDAPAVPRFRGAEGQRALDLNPEETRKIMQMMNPERMAAPRDPNLLRPTGVQVTDLSGIDPRAVAALAGAGTAGVVLGNMGDNMQSVEEGPAVGAVSTTTGESLSQSLTSEEAAALNEYVSSILNSAGQNPGALSAIIQRNAPRSPENYQNPYQYSEDVARFIAGLQSGQFRDMAAALEAEQSGAILDPEAPGLSEQTAEQVTSGIVGSALGNDNDANAVGQAIAAGDNARIAGMAGTLEGAAEAQKNNEIIDATRPVVSSELSRTQTFLQEAAGILNNQAEIQRRIQADSEAAMRAGMSPMAQRIRFEGDIRDRDVEARASFDPRFDRR